MAARRAFTFTMSAIELTTRWSSRPRDRGAITRAGIGVPPIRINWVVGAESVEPVAEGTDPLCFPGL